MCHGLLRCLGFKEKKCLKCEVLVRSQLWDELRACGFLQLRFKSASELEIQASKYDAGLEHKIARFASPPCCGLLVTTFLPMQYP